MRRRKDSAFFMISVVARQFGVHPQTLRLYEREGLLSPSRTEGNTRLYSERDLETLSLILSLTRDLGVNLAGVEIILNMRRKIERMQLEVAAIPGVREVGIGSTMPLRATEAVFDVKAEGRALAEAWLREGRRELSLGAIVAGGLTPSPALVIEPLPSGIAPTPSTGPTIDLNAPVAIEDVTDGVFDADL